MYKILQKSKAKTGIYAYVFGGAILLSFHYYFITYINSTFLEGIVGRSNVGIIYALGGFINIILFLKMASLIRKHGSYNFIIALSVFEIISLLILAFVKNPIIIVIAFMLRHAINPGILACIDMYLEDSSDTAHIGKTRGTFLTILALAAVISPLAIGSLVTDGDFKNIYLFSGFFMALFLIFAINNFKQIPGGQFKEIKVWRELKEFFKKRNIGLIGLCAMLLQFFYSWMIIYLPIYLRDYMNFTWGQVALIISISLVPFIIFEIPVGELADKKLDEREILILGFFISAFSLLLFPFVEESAFLVWIAVVFLARTGACIIETASESYFFRYAKGKDELIGIFRIASPFSFIIGPLLGSLFIVVFNFRDLFAILGAIMLFGVLFAYNLSKEN